MSEFIKNWDFKTELDDAWEAISEKNFLIERKAGLLLIENFKDGDAPVYLDAVQFMATG